MFPARKIKKITLYEPKAGAYNGRDIPKGTGCPLMKHSSPSNLALPQGHLRSFCACARRGVSGTSSLEGRVS